MKDKVKNIIKYIIIVLVVIVVAVAASFAVNYIVGLSQYNKSKEAYLSINDDKLDELFNVDNNIKNDVEVVEKFENVCLGNDNVSTMSFGNYCEKNGIICKSTTNTLLNVNNEEVVISEYPSSYISIVGNNVYFRNDIDRKYYKYDMTSKQTECVIEKQCSEVVVDLNGIHYIDFSNSQLYFKQFDGDEAVVIENVKINSFAVIGNQYLCLTDSKELGWVSNNGFDVIYEGVDRFYYNGNIVIQKNNNILVLSTTKYRKTRVLTVNGVLVALTNDELYIYENSEIAIYNIETLVKTSTAFALNDNEIPKSIFSTDNGIVMFVYCKDTDLYKLRIK